VQIDLEGPHPISEGDVYLLCSDGLTGRVEDAEIGAILASLPPAEATQALVDLANLRGGPDNVTVLVGKAVGPELVGGAAGAQPFHRASPQPVSPVAWIAWSVAAACAVAAAGAASMAQLPVAGIALGSAAVAGVVGLVIRFGGAGAPSLGRSNALGKGPYTKSACAPSHELAQKLAATLDELREAARDGEWTIQWQPLDDSCQLAVAADQAGNYTEAVRHYCRGISYVMNELRSQNLK
jgi:protein phosphatase